MGFQVGQSINLASRLPNILIRTVMQDEQWQEICQQVKQTLPGTPQEQEDTLRRRLLRFFGNSSLEQSRFYVPRREIVRSPLLAIQQNSLIFYGVDFMSSHRLESYMAPWSAEMGFIDDSHCALQFSDWTGMVGALYSKLLSPTVDAATFQAKLSCSSTMKLQWMQLQPYIEMGLQRRMWARFLTSQDLQEGENKNRTFLQTYLHAKQQFISNMQRFSQEALLPKHHHSRSRSRDSERKDNNNVYWSGSVRGSNRVSSPHCPCLQQHLVNSLKEVRGSRRDESTLRRNYRPHQHARPHQHQHTRPESTTHPNDLKQQIVPNFRPLPPSKPLTLSQKLGSHPAPHVQQQRSPQQKQQQMIASLLQQLQKYKFDSDEPSFDKFVNSRSKRINRSNSDFTVFDISQSQS